MLQPINAFALCGVHLGSMILLQLDLSSKFSFVHVVVSQHVNPPFRPSRALLTTSRTILLSPCMTSGFGSSLHRPRTIHATDCQRRRHRRSLHQRFGDCCRHMLFFAQSSAVRATRRHCAGCRRSSAAQRIAGPGTWTI